MEPIEPIDGNVVIQPVTDSDNLAFALGSLSQQAAGVRAAVLELGNRRRRDRIFIGIALLIVVSLCILTVAYLRDSHSRGQTNQDVLKQIQSCTVAGQPCSEALSKQGAINTARGIAAVVDCYNKANLQLDQAFETCLETELSGPK